MNRGRCNAGANRQLTLLVLLSVPTSAVCGQLIQSAGFNAETQYDSNPIMLAEDEVSVWRGIFVPQYRALLKRGDLEFEGSGELRVERSSDEDVSNNRNDPFVLLGVTKYHARGEVSTDATYQQSSTRVTELSDTGQLFSDSTLTESSLRIDLEHAFTERTSIDGFANYLDAEYDDDIFVNYTLFDIGIRGTLVNTPRLSTYVEAMGSSYEPDEANTEADDLFGAADSILLLAGFTYRVNQSIHVELSGGGVDVSGDVDDSDWNGGASVHYRGERLDVDLGFSKTTAASGAGGFVSAEDTTLRIDYRTSARSTLSINGQWRKNLDEGLNDSTLFEIRSETRLSEPWTVGGALSYREVIGIGDASGYSASLFINYRLPERS